MSDCCANNDEVAILSFCGKFIVFLTSFCMLFVMYWWKECTILIYYLGQVQVIFENIIPHRFSDNYRHDIKLELPYI